MTDERIEVVTTVWIDNPNPGISGGGATVDYELAMNEIRLAEGSKSDITVPSGRSTSSLHTDVFHHQLPEWWASHVENDEVSDLHVVTDIRADAGPFSASPTVTHEDEVETDVERMIRDSLEEHEGEHSYRPIDVGDGPVSETVTPRVVVEDTDASFEEVTEAETELHAEFVLHNPNPYPLALPAFTGTVEASEMFLRGRGTRSTAQRAMR